MISPFNFPNTCCISSWSICFISRFNFCFNSRLLKFLFHSMISWILPLTALNASQLSVIMSVFLPVLYLWEQWPFVPVHLCFGLNCVRVQVSTFVSGCFHPSSKLLLLLECLNTYYSCCMILLARTASTLFAIC